MIKLIGMYLLIGIVVLFGSAIWISFSLYKLSAGDDDVYYKSIDIVTQIPESCDRVRKMLSGQNKNGIKKYFANLAFNIAAFPYTVPIMLSRYPEAKEYVIKNRSVKIRES